MESLKGMFLVSMPALKGDYFHHSVTFLLDHNEDGAFGLVINTPTSLLPGEIFPKLQGDYSIDILEGGPVGQDRVFFLHTPDRHYEHSLIINAEATMTTSSQIIDDIAAEKGPKQLLAMLGYAGWGANQLEDEILSDAWLVTPFDSSILYATDHEQKPQNAAQSMGIDLNLIGSRSGNG
jgi:putative transcriptional regulator